jgi:3-phenylpropionate/trans-cinnamate dioxygenase ferredoxin component
MSTPGRNGGWVRACSLAELGEDEPVHADLGQCPVCLVRTGGAVYAVRNECTHQAVPLSEGEVAGGAIECWLHGSCLFLRYAMRGTRPAAEPSGG